MTHYQPIKNKKILVSGGAGFIGSNLCENLLEHHNTIVCLDNLSTGKLKNIAHLLENPQFTFINGDIRSTDDCQKALKNVDAVLHHAALGSVPRSTKDPITSHDVNITGFLNILRIAQQMGVKRFVYASSSSVYGDHPGLPKVEEQIGSPLSHYAVTKRCDELYSQSFSHLYPELEIIGLRYFNVFGKRQTPDGPYAAVIPKFIQSLMEHKAPVIHGNGTQSRDFTYIENVIQANHLALTATNPEAFNQVYNIGIGDNLNLNDLTALLKEYLSNYDEAIQPISLEYGPAREGDVAHSLASIEKAKKLLGYRPNFTVKEGLKHSIAWYWQEFNSQNELCVAKYQALELSTDAMPVGN